MTAAEKLNWIIDKLDKGMTVYFTTHLRSVAVKAKHKSMLKATSKSLYIQRGKSWDCVDYCKITASV